MKVSIGKSIWDQLTLRAPPVAEGNLEGKTVIVTGANIGMGYEACKHFARLNAGKIILACRSKARGEAAVTKLQEETGYGNAVLRILDLASFDSVKAFGHQITEEEERLDILVENAGIVQDATFTPTEDGWEPALQVNNISQSLLALLLLPFMVQTAKAYGTTPRLVVVSSDVHYYWANIPAEVIDSPNPLRLFGRDAEYVPKVLATRYADTKLLNVLFVRALSKRLGTQPVIVNCLNPGYCYSGLRRNYSKVQAVIDWLMEKALARTSEEGSRQIIFASVALEDKKDELRGAYISMSVIQEPSDWVISEEGNRAENIFWNNLIEELIKIDPKIQDIINDLLQA